MLYPVQTLSFVGQVNMEYEVPIWWCTMEGPRWRSVTVMAVALEPGRSHVVGDFCSLERRAGACRILCQRTCRWAK